MLYSRDQQAYLRAMTCIEGAFGNIRDGRDVIHARSFRTMRNKLNQSNLKNMFAQASGNILSGPAAFRRPRREEGNARC